MSTVSPSSGTTTMRSVVSGTPKLDASLPYDRRVTAARPTELGRCPCSPTGATARPGSRLIFNVSNRHHPGVLVANVGIVLISHSAMLAEGAAELASQMCAGLTQIAHC